MKSSISQNASQMKNLMPESPYIGPKNGDNLSKSFKGRELSNKSGLSIAG